MSSHVPSHLPLTLLCGLLWASSFGAQARELRPAEPLRVTLVSLARQATASAPEATGSKLSVRRAWASDTQAQLCALALDTQGQPVLDKGRFQVRRVQFERQQANWRVQRVDTAWLAADASLDTVCPRARNGAEASGTDAPPTHEAKRPKADIDVAIAEMARNPPTAGLPGGRPGDAARDTSRCASQAAASTRSDAVASNWANGANEANGTNWQAGRITPVGRSHLFSAPDATCALGKHLVQGDHVKVGPSRQGWTQVRYTHPITNVVTVGWLPSQKVSAAEAQVASAGR